MPSGQEQTLLALVTVVAEASAFLAVLVAAPEAERYSPYFAPVSAAPFRAFSERLPSF